MRVVDNNKTSPTQHFIFKRRVCFVSNKEHTISHLRKNLIICLLIYLRIPISRVTHPKNINSGVFQKRREKEKKMASSSTASKEFVNKSGNNYYHYYNNNSMIRISTFITNPYTTAIHSSTPLFH